MNTLQSKVKTHGTYWLYFTVVVRMMVIMNIYLQAYPFKENVKKWTKPIFKMC